MFDDYTGALRDGPAEGGRVEHWIAGGLSGMALLDRIQETLAEEVLAEDNGTQSFVCASRGTCPVGVDGDVLLDVATEAASFDPATATDEQLVAVTVGVEHARRFLDALSLHTLTELDVRAVTDDRDGLLTGAWLAHQTQLPSAACTARVKIGWKLRTHLPDVDRALTEGRISFEHARVLCDTANPRIITDFALITADLVDAASRLGFDQWKREVTALAALLDADGGHTPGDDIGDNTLRMHRGLDNTLQLAGQLCADLALIVEHGVNTRADQIFHRLRSDENLAPELRVPARTTLLAMAMAELISEALADNHGSSTAPQVEVSLIVNAADPATVTTTHGVRIGDTTRDTLLCDPVFRVIVMGVDGIVLDKGREQRLASREQKHAMAHRDGGCIFPGCDRPPSWTDAHHSIHWNQGGHTDLALLASLCRYHHGVSHRDAWTMHVTEDQWFWWHTPTGHTFWSQRHGQQRAGPTPNTS